MLPISQLVNQLMMTDDDNYNANNILQFVTFSI